MALNAVSQLLGPDKDREVLVPARRDHEKAYLLRLYQLRNCYARFIGGAEKELSSGIK